jgi:hypothetical protein
MPIAAAPTSTGVNASINIPLTIIANAATAAARHDSERPLAME